MNIYVGNLAPASTSEGLKQLFEQYGPVTQVRIMMDKLTGKPRGFGFVEMANEDEAMKAVEALNGKALDGNALRVTKANPPTDRGSRPARF